MPHRVGANYGTAKEAAEKCRISSKGPKSGPQGLKPALIMLSLRHD